MTQKPCSLGEIEVDKDRNRHDGAQNYLRFAFAGSNIKICPPAWNALIIRPGIKP